MLEIVKHINLFIPPCRMPPHPIQVCQLRDLQHFVFLVELADGAQFPRELVVTGVLWPDDVIEITVHAWQPRGSRSAKDLKGVSGRAVVIEVERDKPDRRDVGSRDELPGRHRHFTHDQLGMPQTRPQPDRVHLIETLLPDVRKVPVVSRRRHPRSAIEAEDRDLDAAP